MASSTKQKKQQHIGVLTAGFLCAAACVFFFQIEGSNNPNVAVSGPVALKAISDAKKLMRKSKWLDAAELLRDHAISGNPEVLYEYGRMLSYGWGTPRDLDKAREKLLLAVQHDFSKRAATAYELGRLYQKSAGPDCHRIAFEWFSKAAEWGHAKANAELGRHYARGIGVPKDLNAAMIRYQKAAELGSASAVLSFANLLASEENLADIGIDANQLIVEAIPLLEAEAADGRASSAKVLGRLYRDGLFVAVDGPLAQRWLRRSALLGDTGGMHDLAQLLLLSAGTEESSAEAIEWLQAAADRGDGSALTALGRLHVSSKFGLSSDEAIGFFQRGIKAGHPGSMTELAEIYLEGELAHSNRQQAQELASRAAALGHKGAIALLRRIEQKMLKTTKTDSPLATGATFVISSK